MNKKPNNVIKEKSNKNETIANEDQNIEYFTLPNYNFDFSFEMDLLIKFFIVNQDTFKDYTFSELMF